ncbi:Zinc finger, B-box [Corchorus capsularis]|uniref:Zinc finger, B-box n=1 Tax=Corchorus capsularis TaxID=210143 RepID=A0A1R3HQ89_COCAP|nr:Zinc finger, B-box [Corchorus capsularis]
MISSKNVANAVGGKTARACDSCIKKRARWYCAADDAFLCQSCDSSVHSANPLARRHERVRLKTSSLKSTNNEGCDLETAPSWHKGFTRKARTRRPTKVSSIHQKLKAEYTKRNCSNPVPLVPEVGADEISHEENEEEQLLYRVPIFDPFVAELCTSTTSNEEAAVGNNIELADAAASHESKACLGCNGQDGLFPSEMDLAEFAADVESLLGKGLENESFAMEELGLMDSNKDNDFKECCLANGKVKIEDEESFEAGGRDKCQADSEMDMAREPFELNFDYDSPASCGEQDESVKDEVTLKYKEEGYSTKISKKRKILLSLDYESVIAAWATQGSPWTSGDRPEFDPDEYWPDCMGTGGTEFHHCSDLIGMGMGGLQQAMGDGGREARVSRYREKRRTRLFSKKIRYEVRKLNAEKRPRMKGRFVKRTSFVAPPVFSLHNK